MNFVRIRLTKWAPKKIIELLTLILNNIRKYINTDCSAPRTNPAPLSQPAAMVSSIPHCNPHFYPIFATTYSRGFDDITSQGMNVRSMKDSTNFL